MRTKNRLFSILTGCALIVLCFTGISTAKPIAKAAVHEVASVAELLAAFEVAETWDQISITQDIQLQEDLVLYNKVVSLNLNWHTLDLNGHQFTFSGWYSAVTYGNIINGVFEVNSWGGGFDSMNMAYMNMTGYGIYVKTGTLKLVNSNFFSNCPSGAVYYPYYGEAARILDLKGTVSFGNTNAVAPEGFDPLFVNAAGKIQSLVVAENNNSVTLTSSDSSYAVSSLTAKTLNDKVYYVSRTLADGISVTDGLESVTLDRKDNSELTIAANPVLTDSAPTYSSLNLELQNVKIDGADTEDYSSYLSTSKTANTFTFTVASEVLAGKILTAQLVIATLDGSEISVTLPVSITDTTDYVAAEVIEIISALPAEITLNDKTAVEEARTAYNALTEIQKEAVNNLAKLTAAELTIAQLEDNIAAAAAVTSLIDVIPTEVTLENKTAVTAARTAYNALTNAQKAAVTNYEKLTAAETAIANLEQEEEPTKINCANSGIPFIGGTITLLILVFCILFVKKRNFQQ